MQAPHQDAAEQKGDEQRLLVTTVLIEEFKARWQQVMAWDSQTDKWMASCIIALVVGVSWILSSERVTHIDQLFRERDGDNSYFILVLAVVNAAYSLYITFMGYQIHQLRLYLYKEIYPKLFDVAGLRVI